MKKITCSALFGAVLLFFFLFIPSKHVFAINTNNDASKLIPVNVNGHVIYEIVGDRQREIQQNKPANLKTQNLVTDANSSITFTIQDPDHMQSVKYVFLHNKFYLSNQPNDYYYNTDWNPNCTTTQTVDGWQVQFNSLDWSNTDTIYAFIITSKYVFSKQIKPTQMGESIPLVPDETYTTVGANIVYAGEGYSYQGTQVNYKDENGVPIGGAYLDSQTMIPSGTYDFITMANDNNYSYYLIKTNFQLSKTNNTLKFERQDAGQITLNVHDLSSYDMKPYYFYGFGGNLNEYWGSFIPSDANKVYISKLNYTGFQVWNKNSAGWQYCYSYEKPIDIVDDTTVMDFGTNFKASFRNGYNYIKGQTCSDLSIRDEYDNRIINMYVPDGRYPIGTLEITDSNNAKTTLSMDIRNTLFNMPDTAGTYAITYNVSGAQYPVEPLPSTKISVIENGGGLQVLGTPLNLRTTFVSGSEVDLTWDYYYYNDGTTTFNIYRAESSDGPFTLVGNSVSNAYYDRNVKPSTDYWYYVKASNNLGEGEPSSTVNFTTTSDITTDNSIKLSIQDQNHELIIKPDEIELLLKQVNRDNSYQYLYTYIAAPSIEKTQSGWVIKQNGLEWSQTKEYMIIVNATKYVFQTAVDQTKLGTIIPLSPDNTYTTIGADIRYAGSGLIKNGIQAGFKDENGISTGSAYLQSETMIPSGRYDFTVTAHDSTNSYYLKKNNFDLTKSNNLINFERQDAGLITLNMHDSIPSNMKINRFYAFDANGSAYSGAEIPSIIDSVYVSKMTYTGFQVNAVNGAGWYYSYYCPRGTDIVDDTTALDFGTNFKVDFRYKNTNYVKGQKCYDLVIKDEYNNILNNMFSYNGVQPTGILEITDSKGIKTTININNINFISFNVPEAVGEYTITFSVTGTQYPVEPLPPTKITVVDGNSGSQVPGTPSNLRTIFTSGSELDLTWDYNYYNDGTTIFNIYRCESSKGPFTLVGNSVTNAYYDRSVKPSTSYWYYVKASNSFGEGELSNTVNFTTTANITPDISITLSIQDKNHELTLSPYNIQFILKETCVDNSYQYANISGGLPQIEKNQDGWAIKYNNIDWNRAKEYKVFVTTSKYLLQTSINETMLGTTIPLSADDTFVPIQVSIPFTSGTVNIQGIQVNYLDENGVPINAGVVSPGILIPAGSCDFQVLGKDDSYGYYLYKRNYTVSRTNNVISFDRSEVGIVKTSFSDASGKTATLNSFRIYPNYYFYSISYFLSLYSSDKTYDSLYVSKANNQNIDVYYALSGGYYIDYRAMEPVNIQDDSTVIDFNTNFKCNINLPNSNYAVGQDLHLGELFVTDGSNNRLNNISGYNVNITGLVEFIDSNGSTAAVIPLKDYEVFNPYIQIPNITGTYTIKYSISGTPFTIAPATATITINNSNQGQLPETPLNLRTTFTSGSELDLTWDYYYYQDTSTYFNIYRAENADGPFTQIGSSMSRAYFDRNVKPNTSYWYYVKTINNIGESEPSSPINLTTTGVITKDNSATFSIEDPKHEQIVSSNSVQFVYKQMTGDNLYQYSYFESEMPYIAKNQNGWTISYNNLNWNTAKEYKVFVNTEKILFEAAIDESKQGAIIPLVADDTYVPLQVNMPFATGTVNVQGINVRYSDENGVSIDAGNVANGIMLPVGKYDFVVIGTDDKYGFYLDKRNYTISKTNSIINFDRAEAVIIKTNLVNTTGKTAHITFFKPYTDDFGYRGLSIGNITNSYSEFYVSKQENLKIYAVYETTDAQFGYMPATVLDVNAEPLTVNFDTNFKCNINLQNKNYVAGEYLNYGSLFVTDGLNNRMLFISDSGGQKPIGKVEFLDSTGAIVAAVTLNDDNVIYPSIKLPEITGTFTIRYSISGRPLAIAHATATITINDSIQINKDALNKAITDAEVLLASKVAGTQPGNVPQSAMDTFKAAIDTAKGVRDNPNATQEEVDAQITTLAAATTAFNNSIITLSNTIKCGDVNGDGTVDLNDSLEIMYYKSHLNSKMSDNAKVNILVLNIADVNGDGAVDLSDSLEIKYYKAHMNSSMSAEALKRINTIIP